MQANYWEMSLYAQSYHKLTLRTYLSSSKNCRNVSCVLCFSAIIISNRCSSVRRNCDVGRGGTVNPSTIVSLRKVLLARSKMMPPTNKIEPRNLSWVTKPMIDSQRSAPPWVGAERKKILAKNVSQIAGNCTSQAYLSHINRENISNIVRIKHYLICSNGAVWASAPFSSSPRLRACLMTNKKVVTLSVYK